MRWNDQLKGGKADHLRPQDFPKKTLLAGMRHELEHTKSHRLAMEIAMDHLAEDPEYYEKLKKIERHQNPSVARRQQRFMCAEYGRKRRGQRTKTGMSRGQLKEFCQRRVKNPADWAMIGQGIVYEMSKHNLSMEKAYEVAKRKLMADPEVYQLATNIRLGVEHMRRKKNPKEQWYVYSTMEVNGQWRTKQFHVKEFPYGDPKKARGFLDVRGPFSSRSKALAAKEKLIKAEHKWKASKTYQQRKKKYKLDDYSINPHLTSGKWRFIGMFEKQDIPSVRRILRIHGMKHKVTRDHLKREPGMRELYVERGGYDTAYRAITRLFEGGRAA